MEDLSIQDRGGSGIDGQVLGQPPPPQQPQQLPAQMFTTAAQLLDLTDKKLMIALRDGRKLIGVLRSWDQFANIVLQNTVERIFVPPQVTSNPDGTLTIAKRGMYADIPQGIYLVRGENVLLLGEIDLDKDDEPPLGYDAADPDMIKRLAKERRNQETTKEKGKLKKLATHGFEGENMGEILI